MTLPDTELLPEMAVFYARMGLTLTHGEQGIESVWSGDGLMVNFGTEAEPEWQSVSDLTGWLIKQPG